MRCTVPGLIIGALAFGAPAAAEDAQALEGCLDQVAAAQGATGERLFDARACQGSLEFLCSELGGDDCVGRERSAWEALAREALATLAETAADAETAQALERTQGAWEDWLAADCALVMPFLDDPAMTEYARGYCERDAWAERAITLRARAANVF